MESQRETAQAHSDNDKRPAEVQPLAPEPLAKQVKRRGLLAAVFALGAGAAAKLAGAGRAEAANGDFLVIGNSGVPPFLAQTAAATTQLDYNGTNAGLIVECDVGPAFTSINGTTLGSGNRGVEGTNVSAGGIGVAGFSAGVGVYGGASAPLSTLGSSESTEPAVPASEV